MTLPRIGYGLYNHHREHLHLIEQALDLGYSFFDTAPNYCNGDSEKNLGRAVNNLHNQSRPLISSKVGYFRNTEEKESWVKTEELATNSLYHNNTIDSSYIRYSIERTVSDLNTPSLDIVFLHNPEVHVHQNAPQELYKKIHAAFSVLEEFCVTGKIKAYGIASWDGFLHGGPFTIAELIKIASSINSAHHFRFIQQPVSLVKYEPVYDYFFREKESNFLRDAEEYNIAVISSSPFANGKLSKVLQPGFMEYFGVNSIAEVCILFPLSVPSIKSCLCGASNAIQLAENTKMEMMENLSTNTIKNLLKKIANA